MSGSTLAHSEGTPAVVTDAIPLDAPLSADLTRALEPPTALPAASRWEWFGGEGGGGGTMRCGWTGLVLYSIAEAGEREKDGVAACEDAEEGAGELGTPIAPALRWRVSLPRPPG
ncbi:hypothetical protein EMIHUDRAFT_357840 [Emiliania huxleyi CCMP1516]|uniref:Uncharacterized protein n=2 Tax=Emiliania huxleyi TaxID=2903 RepID=A0A0D3IJF3_EMIH1|nr:hypothetical protein EMIHUDRAFT_357840 [Emiliania huxleyi CCMP1516]EOD11388.1 hypothetical protein EMIHUDRAFT_357840 [Emiliania huxleyi CCMP1516]|eukprot:XP_005763817.1 hypothetical protein EMIHUDRAFT_357840 [Emiliania huxleyi CCMP1516]